MHCPIRVHTQYENAIVPVSCPATARGQRLVSLRANKLAAWFVPFPRVGFDPGAGSLCFHPWPVFVLFGGIQCSSDSSLTHCSALWLFGINALTIQRECAKRWQKVSAVGVREEEHSCDAKHGAIVAT